MVKPHVSERRADLRVALARHRPADAEEHRHLSRMRLLVEAAGDPFSRTRYDPGHFTASAFILSPDGAKLLLILHAKLGLWLQPGGHVDPGDDTLVAAALREVREETGVVEPEIVGSGLFDVDVHTIPGLGGAPAHEHFDVRFLLRASSEQVGAASDALAARWIALGEIDRIQSDASVLRAAGKLRRSPR